MIENFWLNALFSVTPTVIAGLFFWFVLRSVLRADRSEREAYNKMLRAERIKRGLPPEPLLDQGKKNGLADPESGQGHEESVNTHPHSS